MQMIWTEAFWNICSHGQKSCQNTYENRKSRTQWAAHSCGPVIVKVPAIERLRVGDYTYTDSNTYWVDETGVMATSGEWEGGVILPDGSIYIDEVSVDKKFGRLAYWRNTNFAPKQTIGDPVPDNYSIPGTVFGISDWKYHLLEKWENTLKEEYGTYTLDYQLPANWKEICPKPIMTSNIDYICFNIWGGWGIVNWNDSWKVDENNIIHITATYFPENQ